MNPISSLYWWYYRTSRNLPYKIRCIKWFFIRGWNGWAPNDTWDLDSYLTRVICESVKALSQRDMSVPDHFKEPKHWKTFLMKQIHDLEAWMQIEDEVREFKTADDVRAYGIISQRLNARRKSALKKLMHNIDCLWD